MLTSLPVQTWDFFSGKRSLTSFSKVQRVWSTLVRGKKWQLRSLDLRATPYLNIGCGRSTFQGFVNLDCYWFPGIHVCWDITKGLPFSDNVFRGIFSEHCLEHITLDQCRQALREAHRTLQPGGTLRIILPDAGLYLNVYLEKQNGREAMFPYGYGPVMKQLTTPMMCVNEVFREHGHQYAYDVETFSYLLREAGFHNINRTDFKKGSDPKLLIDSLWRKTESFYMEATKPESP